VTTDLTPALGYVGDHRVVYSLGCIGHGVSMSYVNGRELAALLLERPETDLPPCPFINRRMIPWPPEPLQSGVTHALRGYLRAEDGFYERGLVKD